MSFRRYKTILCGTRPIREGHRHDSRTATSIGGSSNGYLDGYPPNQKTQDELERYESACIKTAAAIIEIQRHTAKNISEKEAEIFDAHFEILNDEELKNCIKLHIEAGRTAEYAVHETAVEIAGMFRNMKDNSCKLRFRKCAELSYIKRRIFYMSIGGAF